MRLYERFADKGYHSSIATTFGIDFDAYENIVLPRIRGPVAATTWSSLTHACWLTHLAEPRRCQGKREDSTPPLERKLPAFFTQSCSCRSDVRVVACLSGLPT